MTLQKGLIIGLMGIHDPDVLCCFNGVTYCPWCGKMGQNKGTIVNHMRMVHYKLGLICEKCLGCSSISSETIHCHSQKGCTLSGEGGPDESSSSAQPHAQAVLGQHSFYGNMDGGLKGGSSIPWVTLLGIVPAQPTRTQMKD